MCKFIFCLLIMPISFLLYAFSTESHALENDFRLAILCNSCHGEKGLSSGEYLPSIKGQSKDYLVAVMKGFKDGSRYSTLMQTLAKGYSEDKIVGVSTWFNKMDWEPSPQKVDAKKALEGKKLAAVCSGCHNDEAESYVPKIESQQAKYLNEALLEYKNKMRGTSDSVEEMDTVIEMKDSELKALAEYFGSLK